MRVCNFLLLLTLSSSFFCVPENNSCRVYRDPEQSHDDAHHRPAIVPAKVCPAEDEAARCKYPPQLPWGDGQPWVEPFLTLSGYSRFVFNFCCPDCPSKVTALMVCGLSCGQAILSTLSQTHIQGCHVFLVFGFCCPVFLLCMLYWNIDLHVGYNKPLITPLNQPPLWPPCKHVAISCDATDKVLVGGGIQLPLSLSFRTTPACSFHAEKDF